MVLIIAAEISIVAKKFNNLATDLWPKSSSSGKFPGQFAHRSINADCSDGWCSLFLERLRQIDPACEGLGRYLTYSPERVDWLHDLHRSG